VALSSAASFFPTLNFPHPFSNPSEKILPQPPGARVGVDVETGAEVESGTGALVGTEVGFKVGSCVGPKVGCGIGAGTGGGVGLPEQCSVILPHQPHSEQHKLGSAQIPFPGLPFPQGVFETGAGTGAGTGAVGVGAVGGVGGPIVKESAIRSTAHHMYPRMHCSSA